MNSSLRYIKLILPAVLFISASCSEMLGVDFDLFPPVKRAGEYYSADLSSVDFGHGRLYPALSKTNLAYIGAPIPTGVDATTIRITAESSGAVIELNGSAVEQNTDIPLPVPLVGSNPIIITVTAEDGSTTKTYNIDCYRAIPVYKTGAEEISGYTLNLLEDGFTQYGEPWPAGRFVDNGTYVTDTMTGLEWVKDASASGTINWSDAIDCLAGGWRMPNREEMRSLINYGEIYPLAWLNNNHFTNAGSKSFFTSTTVAKSTTFAWITNATGQLIFNVNKDNTTTYTLPVRLVSTFVSATGQTTSYRPGDDGTYRRGVTWPVPRFMNNGDGTVTDAMTGLTWLMNAASIGQSSWESALSAVAALNDPPALYGKTDWRLPNINELATLMNSGRINVAGWLESEGFNTVRSFYYWSSTSVALSPANKAWCLDLREDYSGALNYKDSLGGKFKTDEAYVWPVRDGNAAP